jgi:hypothetical protein
MKKLILVWLCILVSNCLAISIQTTDSSSLNGFSSSYYLNSSNQNSGTLSTTRLSGAYSGITKLGTLSELKVVGETNLTGNVSLSVASLWTNQSQFGVTSKAGSPVRMNGASLFIAQNWTGSPPSNGAYISGTVGIGTISPQRKLSVVGDIQCTGNIYNIGTDGALITGQVKTCADNVATEFLDYTMPTNSGGVIFLDYTIVETNGTTINVNGGYASLSVRNQNGTMSSNLNHPATLENDLGITADTLTVADGVGKSTLSIQVNTTAATYKFYYNVRRCGSGTATPL